MLALLVAFATPLGSCGPASWRTTTEVNLRSCPSTSSDCGVLLVLRSGTEIDMISKQGAWYRVRDPHTNTEGWVYSKYVTSSSPSFSLSLPSWLIPRLPEQLSSKQLRILFLPIAPSSFVSLFEVAVIVFTIAIYGGIALLISYKLDINPGPVIAVIIFSLLFGVAMNPKLLTANYFAMTVFVGFIATLFGAIAFGASVRVGHGGGITLGVVSFISAIGSLLFQGLVLEIQLLFSAAIILDLVISSSSFEEFLSDLPAPLAAAYNPITIFICLAGMLLFIPVLLPAWEYIQIAILVLGTVIGMAGAEI